MRRLSTLPYGATPPLLDEGAPRERGVCARLASALTSAPRRILCSPLLLLLFVGSLLGSAALAVVSAYERFSVKRWYVTRLALPCVVVWVWFHVYHAGRQTPRSAVPALSLADCAAFHSEASPVGGGAGAGVEGSGAVGEAALREALLAASGGSGRLLLAVSSTASAALTANWLAAVGALAPAAPRAFVVASDAAEAGRLAAGGVAHVLAARLDSLPLPAGGGAGGGPSEGWRGAALARWAVARVALSAGLDVLLSDVDAVPLRNPLAYIDTLPRCDAFFTTDSSYLIPSASTWTARDGVGGGGWLGWLGLRGAQRHAVSSGLLFLRAGGPGGGGLQLAEGVLALLARVHRLAEWQEAGGEGPPPAEAEAPGAEAPAAPARPPWPPIESEDALLNAALQRLFDSGEGAPPGAAAAAEAPASPAQRPPPPPGGACANSRSDGGALSFHVMSPFLFQSAVHVGIADVINEPPFTRHFNFLAPPPPGAPPPPHAPPGRRPIGEVSVPHKLAFMRDHGAWMLSSAEANRLLCRAILHAAGGAGESA